MDSKNDSFLKEDQLIPKVEPIDPELIKNEKNDEEEECFAVPGIIESLKSDKDSVKKEILENEEIGDCSPSKVRIDIFIG